MSDRPQAKRFFVSGRVQGVGFRYFTQNAAEKLQVSGYTRNLRDGRVEVYAVGTAGQLGQLRSALERGPWLASVTKVIEETTSVEAQHTQAFVITTDE